MMQMYKHFSFLPNKKCNTLINKPNPHIIYHNNCILLTLFNKIHIPFYPNIYQRHN